MTRQRFAHPLLKPYAVQSAALKTALERVDVLEGALRAIEAVQCYDDAATILEMRAIAGLALRSSTACDSDTEKSAPTA